jgi:hypothetical protein
VQAAAVAAHIRDPLNKRIIAALASVDDAEAPVTQVLQIVQETQLALASGLVEEGDRIRLSAAVQALRARALARIDAAAKAHPKGASGLPLAPITLDAYEAFLIQGGRFDEFRRLRARQRRPMYGRFVFRRARWTRRLRVSPGSRAALGVAS